MEVPLFFFFKNVFFYPFLLALTCGTLLKHCLSAGQSLTYLAAGALTKLSHPSTILLS